MITKIAYRSLRARMWPLPARHSVYHTTGQTPLFVEANRDAVEAAMAYVAPRDLDHAQTLATMYTAVSQH